LPARQTLPPYSPRARADVVCMRPGPAERGIRAALRVRKLEERRRLAARGSAARSLADATRARDEAAVRLESELGALDALLPGTDAETLWAACARVERASSALRDATSLMNAAADEAQRREQALYRAARAAAAAEEVAAAREAERREEERRAERRVEDDRARRP
jgi:hypothetical protein